MAIILVWAFCGVLSGLLAASKGYSGVLWFFLGILFGPLAFVIGLFPNKVKRFITNETPSTSRPISRQVVKLPGPSESGPNSFKYYSSYGKTLMRNKAYLDALNMFSSALVIAPSHPEPHLDAGICQINLHNLDAAESHLVSCVRLLQDTTGTAVAVESPRPMLVSAFFYLTIVESQRMQNHGNSGNLSQSKIHWERALNFIRRSMEIAGDTARNPQNKHRFDQLEYLETMLRR